MYNAWEARRNDYRKAKIEIQMEEEEYIEKNEAILSHVIATSIKKFHKIPKEFRNIGLTEEHFL